MMNKSKIEWTDFTWNPSLDAFMAVLIAMELEDRLGYTFYREG